MDIKARVMRLLIIGIISVLLFACNNDPETLKVYMPRVAQSDNFNTFLSLMNNGSNQHLVKYIPLDTSKKTKPIDLLSSHEIDLTIIANSEKFKKDVRIVLPAFKAVLHILARNDLTVNTEDFFLNNHSLYIDRDESVAYDLLGFLAERKHLSLENLNIVKNFELNKTDIIVTFSPILAPKWNLNGYHILSFGEVKNIGHGSKVEAISQFIPQIQSYIIPTNTYLDISGNDKPVVTIAVDMLLATHVATDDETIRDLAEQLMNIRSEISALIPSSFNYLTDRVNTRDFKFQFHTGAKDFIERKKPSLMERYASVISTLVYLVVLLFSGAVAFVRLKERRKKDRIDDFYERLFEIRDKLSDGTIGLKKDCLQNLRVIEHEAFRLLIDEKIAADSSFQIFETLLHDTIAQANQYFK